MNSSGTRLMTHAYMHEWPMSLCSFLNIGESSQAEQLEQWFQISGYDTNQDHAGFQGLRKCFCVLLTQSA
jgi:hypothetical protein